VALALLTAVDDPGCCLCHTSHIKSNQLHIHIKRVLTAIRGFRCTQSDRQLQNDCSSVRLSSFHHLPGASQHEETIGLASVVMKAVQARHPCFRPVTESAGKLGDDADSAKMQVQTVLEGKWIRDGSSIRAGLGALEDVKR